MSDLIAIELSEALRMVLGALGSIAAPRKLPPMNGNYANWKRVGNIDVFFDGDGKTTKFHFVTKDNIEVEVPVDFAKFGQSYLGEVIDEVNRKLNEHRAKRRPIVVRDPTTVEEKPPLKNADGITLQ